MIDMEDTGTIDWFVVEFRGGRPVDGSLVLPSSTWSIGG